MFTISISDDAVQVDYSNLPDEEQKLLCFKAQYDQHTHDIFKFNVSIKSLTDKAMTSNRDAKQKSLDKADRVLMLAEPFEGITVLGIFPTTCDRNGQYSLDFAEGVLIHKTPAENGRLQVVGRVKELIRKHLYKIYASRTGNSGHWIFTKLYLYTSQSFDLELLCAAPKVLAEENRRILCSVTVAEAGRSILTKPDHTVRLPLLEKPTI